MCIMNIDLVLLVLISFHLYHIHVYRRTVPLLRSLVPFQTLLTKIGGIFLEGELAKFQVHMNKRRKVSQYHINYGLSYHVAVVSL